MRDTTGSAAAPAARWRKFRRGNFILNLPLRSHHSITSSARASSVGGISTPSARAVGRLMTNSNLLDCTTGQVGRLSTLEDFAGVDADLTVRFRLARSVAHEAASFRILAYIIDGWNRMSCRQCGKLETPAGKERIRPYQQWRNDTRLPSRDVVVTCAPD